jgi:hypothetical protein
LLLLAVSAVIIWRRKANTRMKSLDGPLQPLGDASSAVHLNIPRGDARSDVSHTNCATINSQSNHTVLFYDAADGVNTTQVNPQPNRYYARAGGKPEQLSYALADGAEQPSYALADGTPQPSYALADGTPQPSYALADGAAQPSYAFASGVNLPDATDVADGNYEMIDGVDANQAGTQPSRANRIRPSSQPGGARPPLLSTAVDGVAPPEVTYDTIDVRGPLNAVSAASHSEDDPYEPITRVQSSVSAAGTASYCTLPAIHDAGAHYESPYNVLNAGHTVHSESLVDSNYTELDSTQVTYQPNHPASPDDAPAPPIPSRERTKPIS